MWRAKDAKAKPQHAGVKDEAEIAVIEKIGMELSIAMEGISAITIRAQQLEFDPALVDHFQRIRTSTETAVAALGDIVDFSKVSGGVVLHKSQFGLRAALADLIARLGPNAEEHDCRLRIKVEQDVTDSIEGDVERLLLVVKNLLDNTFALLPGHEVMLQVTPEYVTEAGIQLSFSVIAVGDTAQPISADAGMGVALAKFMVAAMGGKLAIATRLAADALYAFTLEFPVMPAPPAPRRATYVSLVGLPVMVVSARSGAAPADHQPAARLAPASRSKPTTPRWRWRFSSAMQSEASPIPLVILSNRLPVQDGFLLAFRIKNHAKFRSALVMMLATDGRPGDAIACRENGIAAYMRYPIGDRQLNEAIVAVTGASVDVDETPTLVTRHSLREQRKGATILLIDPNRESQILASHILGRQDCSVVAAQDLAEATAALDQDMYDIVLVDTSLPGLDGDDAATLLRARIARDADKAVFVAVSLDHSPQLPRSEAQGRLQRDDRQALPQGRPHGPAREPGRWPRRGRIASVRAVAARWAWPFASWRASSRPDSLSVATGLDVNWDLQQLPLLRRVRVPHGPPRLGRGTRADPDVPQPPARPRLLRARAGDSLAARDRLRHGAARGDRGLLPSAHARRRFFHRLSRDGRSGSPRPSRSASRERAAAQSSAAP